MSFQQPASTPDTLSARAAAQFGNRHGAIGMALAGTECRIGDAVDPRLTLATGDLARRDEDGTSSSSTARRT